jgi:DNA-binding transcriptional LysR family regulator
MHIGDIDLNLLRIFDAVYRARNVSRAAEALGMSQPAVSHGVTRLRLLLGNPLFERASGGVRPTPQADHFARAVQQALQTLEAALQESAAFDPARSNRIFRFHMSDIGEGVFLPAIMRVLRTQAPGIHVETYQLPPAEIVPALDSGRVDAAFGYLPDITGTERQPLVTDRYVVLLRSRHPSASARATLQTLKKLDYLVVRSHSETLRILTSLNLQDRIRLTTAHFMVIPAIVAETDLAAVMPRNIARNFVGEALNGRGAQRYTILDPRFHVPDFVVSLHWSRRFEHDGANRWLRGVVTKLFSEAER